MRLLDRYRPAVIEELRSVFDGRTLPPYSFMRYHLGWQDRDGRPIAGRPGKLLRPSLCLLCCEAVGGDWRTALPAAAALELLHNFTLIHDDVEDESAQRHGRDTLWSLWGQAQAINAGDGMFALAQVALLRLRGQRQPPARVLRASQMLAEATLRLCEGQHRDLASTNEREITPDDYLEMIEGQYLDLQYEGRHDIAMSDYLNMISRKTGALIRCSLNLGAGVGAHEQGVADVPLPNRHPSA